MSLKYKFVIGYLFVAIILVAISTKEIFAIKELESVIAVNKLTKDLVNSIYNEHIAIYDYYYRSTELLFPNNGGGQSLDLVKSDLNAIIARKEFFCDEAEGQLKELGKNIQYKKEVERLSGIFSEYDALFLEYEEFVAKKMQKPFNSDGYLFYQDSRAKIGSIINRMIDFEVGGDNNDLGLDFIQKQNGEKIRKISKNISFYNNIFIASLVAIFLMAIFYLNKDIIGPILRIKKALEKIGDGQYYNVENLNIDNKDEIGWLANEVRFMINKLREDQSKVERIVTEIASQCDMKKTKKKSTNKNSSL